MKTIPVNDFLPEIQSWKQNIFEINSHSFKCEIQKCWCLQKHKSKLLLRDNLKEKKNRMKSYKV